MPPLYDHPGVTSTYFFPQPAEPLPASERARPVQLSLPDGTPIGGYWVSPLQGAPTLLYLHGNGEAISHQLFMWPDWARAVGANIFFVDYPGYASSGGEPTFTGCRQAARAALDFLLDQPAAEVPSVVVVGRSVGSIFALDVAAASPASDRVAGLVLESGVADLRQRLDMRVDYHRLGLDPAQVEAELKRDFDHEAKLQGLRVPVLVLHTRHDGLVPADNGQRLATWAGERLFRLALFDAGDHNSIHLYNAEAYQRHLREFLQSL